MSNLAKEVTKKQADKGAAERTTRSEWGTIALLLAMHSGLVCWQAAHNSPTVDEYAHLVGGLSIWEFGRFELCRVNPPLVKTIAAFPAVAGGAKTDWSSFYLSPFGRPSASVGRDFVEANPDKWFDWLMLARWSLLPLSLLGGIVCYLWSRELYGRRSGLVALALWCFSPNVIAWATTITADIGATSLGVLAGWTFWRWLRNPSWGRVCAAGVAFGLAQLTKMTWVILFGLWPLLWLVWWAMQNRSPAVSEERGAGESRRLLTFWGELRQFAAILVLGVYVMNVGYGFEGSFEPLGSYAFGSRILAGEQNITDSETRDGGNRFAGTWLEQVPVPLPKNYVTGMDLQRVDFERKLTSYLNGEWKKGGWWYYYLETLVLKVPLGTWMIALAALAVTFCSPSFRNDWRDELVLLAPAVAILVLVSSNTGFSRYLRYLLPAFGFVFIWCGKVARSVDVRHHVVAVVTGIGLLWSIGSSLWIHPHSISYFNEIAGGPNGGHRFLLDGNIDWGQDVFYLKKWYDAHPEARPMEMSIRFSPVDIGYFGVENTSIGAATPDAAPAPGWYAVSVHSLFGRNSEYNKLCTTHAPVAKAGYSIWIYHVPEPRSEVE